MFAPGGKVTRQYIAAGACAWDARSLFRTRLLELASGLDQSSGALGFHCLHERERGVPDFGLKCNVTIERFMAGGVRLEVADITVDLGLRAGEHQMHVARPIRQRAAQR